MGFECGKCGGKQTLPGGIFETCAKCGYCSVDRLTQIKALLNEIDSLNAWIADLHEGLHINCVYCGHRYPPGVPDVRDKVLYNHIANCPKHPLSRALVRIAELEQEQYEWASIINSLSCVVVDGISNEGINLANDMIEMVNPYLGLA